MKGLSVFALTALAFVLALSAPAFAKCASAGVLYRTTFDRPDDQWDISSHLQIGHGKMVLHPTPQTALGPLYNGATFPDATVCADFTLTNSKGSDPVGGLIFWASDNTKYYQVVLSPPSHYISVSQASDGRFKSIVGWTRVAAIKSAAGATNEVRVTLRGLTGVATVNGKPGLTFEVPEDPSVPNAWMAGIDAEASSTAPSTWTVTNFTVTK